ncbi:4Fe-4S dicluster domain-containing protein [bacterium]|nr:4Fe-4S dicluster domain-containing protein [bacterium]
MSHAEWQGQATFTIDDKQVTGYKGETILQVARRQGIDIPTLCHHEAIAPYGACRLCLVEVTAGKRTRLVTSCIYEVAPGIDVKTSSERVIRNRKAILELLLARAPDAPKIVELAGEYGIQKSRYPLIKNDKCILCGLCVRACREIIGADAIGFIDRGADRQVGPPLERRSERCVGCGTCIYICPTGAISLKDVSKPMRGVHNHPYDYEAPDCEICGELNLESESKAEKRE